MEGIIYFSVIFILSSYLPIRLLDNNNKIIRRVLIISFTIVMIGISIILGTKYNLVNFDNLTDINKILIAYFGIIVLIQVIYRFFYNMFKKSRITNPEFIVLDLMSKDQCILIPILFLSPVIEEFLFRGMMIDLSNLSLVAITIPSIIFSILHSESHEKIIISLTSFLFYFVLGLVLAISYIMSKNILVPIIIHLFNNIISILSIKVINRKY